MDVIGEYTRAGVRFTGRVSAKGWAECYAADRDESHPSAAVRLAPGGRDHGSYDDKGAEAGSKNPSFFDFMGTHALGGMDYNACLDHYVSRLGIDKRHPGGMLARRGAIGARKPPAKPPAKPPKPAKPAKPKPAEAGPTDGDEIPIRLRRGKGEPGDATYQYPGADGVVSYEVLRRYWGGKRHIFQRAWNDGGWVNTIKDVDPLPYCLPELLAAPPGATVYITEGEKDADRLAAAGAIATTNQGGCGMAADVWPVLAPYFAGLDVVVIPDHDKPGYDRANLICQILTGVADRVRFAALPLTEAGADLSDWMDDGGTLDELEGIAAPLAAWASVIPFPGATNGAMSHGAALPAIRRPATGPGRVGTDDDEDIQITQFPPPANVGDVDRVMGDLEWVWEGWLARAGIAGVAAAEGAGKTRLIADLLRRVWFGLEWPDGQAPTLPAGTPALWICADGQQQEIAKLSREYGLPPEAIYFNTGKDDPCGGTTIDQPIDIERLEHYIGVVRPCFVVVDTLTNATTNYSLNDASEVTMLMGPLDGVAKRTESTVIAVMHLSIVGDVLGRRVKGWTRTLIKIECPDPEHYERLRLWVDKSFDTKPAALGVTMAAAGNDYDDAPPGAVASGPRGGRPPVTRERTKAFIRSRLASGLPYVAVDLRDELAAADDKAARAFWKAVEEMAAAGELEQTDGGPGTGRQVMLRLLAPTRGEGGAF